MFMSKPTITVKNKLAALRHYVNGGKSKFLIPDKFTYAWFRSNWKVIDEYRSDTSYPSVSSSFSGLQKGSTLRDEVNQVLIDAQERIKTSTEKRVSKDQDSKISILDKQVGSLVAEVHYLNQLLQRSENKRKVLIAIISELKEGTNKITRIK